MATKRWCAVLLCVLGLGTGGCFHARQYGPPSTPLVATQDDDHDHDVEPPADPALLARADQILMLQGDAERPTEVIGLLDEHAHMGGETEALARMRRDAARMGGDAIIHVEFHHGGEHHDDGDEAETASADQDTDATVDEDSSDPLALHLSGTVVRFRDLLAGRHYEVIQQLQVHVPMTREADGLAELQREAGELHADLILDVSFHHGHGDEPLEVDGTAIRFVP